MVPSLNSCNLALRPNLLLSTKCNAEVALKAGHFRQLGITIRNLKTITDVIVLNIPRWTFPEHCREWYKCEIDFPKHTCAPFCTIAQLVNLGAIAGGLLGNLGGATSDRLFYACLSIWNCLALWTSSFQVGSVKDFQRLDLEKAWVTDLVSSQTWYNWSPGLNSFLPCLVM
jgi:hypothetical protein